MFSFNIHNSLIIFTEHKGTTEWTNVIQLFLEQSFYALLITEIVSLDPVDFSKIHGFREILFSETSFSVYIQTEVQK